MLREWAARPKAMRAPVPGWNFAETRHDRKARVTCSRIRGAKRSNLELHPKIRPPSNQRLELQISCVSKYNALCLHDI
ncbi:MAG: hypothetical protein JWR26_1435 [Pedosphaera sp.]|nr:hypothetical protein [Pedosphaera sp.]